MLIRAEAEGTDTYELNRNLVLTDGARADSVPNLEIETGEIVGAGHASATGRFDDEQLFYLQARGIPEDEARRLVVRGFFAELVQQIGVADARGAPARDDRGRAGGVGLMADADLRPRLRAERAARRTPPMRVELDGAPVAVVRTEGEVYAINDICSHANVSLVRGRGRGLHDRVLAARLRFDLRTGKPTGLPATAPSPSTP